jgi:lactate dehydrogenase-like 2-hydroxyacid dehydrogenase
LTADEFKTALQNYDAVCPTVCDSFPADVLNVENKRWQISVSVITITDIQAAKANDLIVTNTPNVLTQSTADIAMTLLLMTARRGAEGDRLVRAKQWSGRCPTSMLSSSVTGATLGLIGFGHIGQAMARKAEHGFDMNIIYFSPNPADEYVIQDLNAKRCDTVEELLRQADFVSLHCPAGANTKHLINTETLKFMKLTAHLINTARGDVVDSRALIDALKTKQIAGAGLDVYENEPNIHEGFLELENVALLPHLGSATLETRTAMGEKVLANLAAYFAGETLPDRVV